MARDSKRKSRLVGAAISLVMLVIVFAAAEAAIRIRQQVHYGIAHDVSELFMKDPGTGLKIMRPNLDTGRVRTDSFGFRNPELVRPKQRGTVRLAFLGASTTFCLEVSTNEATWPDIVVRRLQAAMPDTKFDYINAAVPGYEVADAVTMLATRVAGLDPDVIVYYEAHNELTGDTRALALRTGTKFEPPDEPNWILRHSLLLYLVDKNLKTFARRGQVMSAIAPLQYDPEPLANNFEQNLVALVALAKKTASIVVLPTFSQRVRAGQSEEERKNALITSAFYMPYMSADGIIAGYAAYNRAIARAAARGGALLVAGEDTIPADDRNFVDSVHFSDAGSVLQAERVAAALLQYEPLRALARSRARAAAAMDK